jgi:hypothetical protein
MGSHDKVTKALKGEKPKPIAFTSPDVEQVKRFVDILPGRTPSALRQRGAFQSAVGQDLLGELAELERERPPSPFVAQPQPSRDRPFFQDMAHFLKTPFTTALDTLETTAESLASLPPAEAMTLLGSWAKNITTAPFGGGIERVDSPEYRANLEKNILATELTRATLRGLGQGAFGLTAAGERIREASRSRPIETQLTTQIGFDPTSALGPGIVKTLGRGAARLGRGGVSTLDKISEATRLRNIAGKGTTESAQHIRQYPSLRAAEGGAVPTARKHTVEELLEAGGYDEGSASFIPSEKKARLVKPRLIRDVAEDIDVLNRENRRLRNLEGKVTYKVEDEFGVKAWDDLTDSQEGFIEDVLDLGPGYTFADVREALVPVIRSNETRIKRLQAVMAEKTNLDLAAQADAIERGLAAIGSQSDDVTKVIAKAGGAFGLGEEAVPAIKVYTGADESFTQFDVSKLGTRTDPGFAGRGAYTTTDPEQATSWGRHVMEVEIPSDAKLLRISSISELSDQHGLKVLTPEELALPQSQLRPIYAKNINDFTDRMIAEGYDGIEWTMAFAEKPRTQYVLFKPEKYTFTPMGELRPPMR